MVKFISIIMIAILVIGFGYVVFGRNYDIRELSESIAFEPLIPFDVDDLLEGAHAILPDGIAIFDSIENIVVAFGMIGYSFAFGVNLLINLFFI